MSGQKTCGDFGGVTSEGAPCQISVESGRCRYHKIKGSDRPVLHVPTDLTRRFVETCIIGGIPESDICSVIEITPWELEKCYPEELSKARARANAKVAQVAFQMATSGKDKTMTIFWLKSRLGWSDSGPQKTERQKRAELISEIDRRLAHAEEEEHCLVFDD